jgi:hypothetical protein
MKSNSIYKVSILALILTFFQARANAQSFEVQQLLLNWEKLIQMKNILSDMKKGYEIVSQGYNSVKNIANGNFNLHETFIDGLLLVNPEIRKYKRVADIIAYQKDIVSEYRSAFNRFKNTNIFNDRELKYLEKVYKQLTAQSIDNLDELTTVLTSSKLRMSDDERLQAIDWIFADTEDKLQFLRNFNKQASILSLQRQKEKSEINGLNQYYQ